MESENVVLAVADGLIIAALAILAFPAVIIFVWVIDTIIHFF